MSRILHLAARFGPVLLSATLAGCDPPARRADPAPLPELAEGACRVVATDEADAEAGLLACARAAAGLAELLGEPAPRGVLCRTVGPCAPGPGEVWALSLPPDSTAGEPRRLGGGETLSLQGYLTHETAHRIATAILFPHPLPGADTLPSALYGSPLPDWLDEALALAVEPEPDRRARLRLLFEGESLYLLPLRRLLDMPHPALARVPAGAPLRRTFYGQSLAVLIFVQERAGTGGLQRLVGTVRAGVQQGRALTSIPGLPADGGQLEQDWLQWLLARRRVLVGGR